MSWWLTIRNSLLDALLWYWLLSSVNSRRLLKIWGHVIWIQNRLNLTFRNSRGTICRLTLLDLWVIIRLLSLTHYIIEIFFYKIFNFGKVILKYLNWFKIKKITEKEQKWGEVTLSRELVFGRIRDS